MTNPKTLAAIEAILFSMGKEMPVADLQEALTLSDEEMRAALVQLKERYDREESGLTLLELEDKVQLCAKPAHFHLQCESHLSLCHTGF